MMGSSVRDGAPTRGAGGRTRFERMVFVVDVVSVGIVMAAWCGSIGYLIWTVLS